MAAVAAIVGAVLLVAVVAYQVALAAGVPWGAHAYGGQAVLADGTLPPPIRVMSGFSAVILLLAAWVLLAQGGVVGVGPIPDGALIGTTWGLAAFLALNTAGNLTSKSRVERLVFGPITIAGTILSVIVALEGPGPG